MSTVFGMSDEDKREIIADFLLESDQHIQTLNNSLLKAEELVKVGQQMSSEQVDKMFRAAHTIKGTSSMLGFKNLNHLTHQMETVLERVRNKKIALTMPVIEVLFTAFDSINALLDKLRNEGNDQMDVETVIGKIKIILDSDAPTVELSKIRVDPVPTLPQTEQQKKQEATDMSKYLPAFLEDTEACVLRFNEILLGFEKDQFSLDQLNEIFRLAHTIKGSSGIIKCKGIESVAHRMEDLLAFFRSQGVKPTADVTVLLFKGIDWIKNTMDALRKGNYQQGDLTEFLNQFQTLTSRLRNVSAPLEASVSADPLGILSGEISNKIRMALGANNNIFKIIVSIEKRAMKAAKALILEQRLKKTGTVLTSVPKLESIPEVNVDLKVQILYATPNQAEQVRAFLSLDEVEIVYINKEDFVHLKPAVPTNFLDETAVSTTGSVEFAKAGPLEITTMKVDSRKLDILMNLSGELVISRARFAQLVNELSKEMFSKEVAAKIYGLDEATAQLEKLSSDIQSAVMQTRMMPIEGVFSRFKRLVRDIARDLNKDINLELYGEDTELDKRIIDALPDALTHMIRNAIDHGIESKQNRIAAGKNEVGKIQLKASHQGNSICIEIIDDGKGIDAEKLAQKALEKGLVTPEKLAKMDQKDKLNFIFLPGFSTAEKITGLSGRGVGMDVVKKMIESLSGTMDIETEVGQGTRFIFKIPLTLAIIQALLVVINKQVFAIPLESVSEIIRITPKDIYSIDGQPMIKLRGHALILMSMAKILGISQEATQIDAECKVVVVEANREFFGIKVDRLIGEDEIVIKAFPDYFANVKGISGASILGDGRIALILDVNGIYQEA